MQRFSYKIRGDGFKPFVQKVTPIESVESVCSQMLAIIAPGNATDRMTLELSYRHPEQGHMVVIGMENQGEAMCDIVPDKTMLHAKVLEASQNASQKDSKHIQASSEMMNMLHSENAMLKWEEARLLSELKGLHVLAGAMCKSAPSRADFLAPLSESPVDVGATKLLVMNENQRKQNKVLEKELNGLESLVHRLSNKGQGAGRTWRGEAVQGKIHCMPPDGSCLFHSLVFGLGSGSASELRQEVCDFMEMNPDMTVLGRPLQDWILWESGQSAAAYASAMRQPDKWGGPIEIAVCTVLKHVRVHVYKEVPQRGFQRICDFGDIEDQASPTSTLRVVLSPGHYDAFELI